VISLPSIVCSLYGNKYNPLDDLLTLFDLLLDCLQLLLQVGDLLIVLEQEDLIGDRLDSGAALLDVLLLLLLEGGQLRLQRLLIAGGLRIQNFMLKSPDPEYSRFRIASSTRRHLFESKN
jgi:hypothetical protein